MTRTPGGVDKARPALDAVVVPGLLLLLASDLLLEEPSRALAWRLLHEPKLAAAPGWLLALGPSQAAFDRDPLAAALAGGAVVLATVYLLASLANAGVRARATLIALSAALLIGLPTLLYVAVGVLADRPFGQDGGVVQLPLALDRLLSGQSPYGADYSDSILGRQSRASAFWLAYGGNPIVRHHAYLPGTHLLALPLYLVARAVSVPFDPRTLTLLALLAAALLAAALAQGAERRLGAAAVVLLSPLAYWQQSFGANDILFVALLLGVALLLERERPTAAGALLGLACATKQLAWPFAPFLLLHASGARSLGEVLRADAWVRVRRPLAAAALVFLAVVAPVAALDPRAFYADIVAYNMGLGSDAYPFGGTPGFGFANLVLYAGGVRSLREAFPFGPFLLLLVPLVPVLARAQLRRTGIGAALASGCVALLFVLYFSRVPHANYLVAVALLLPLSALLGGARAEAAVVPLLLLGLATTVVERGTFRLVWQQAVDAGLPARLTGLWRALAPRAAPALSDDPLGLAVGALGAGLAVCFAAAAVIGVAARWRTALVVGALIVVVLVPATVVVAIGQRTGTLRAQDTFAVQAPADALRMASGQSPFAPPFPTVPIAREAWSSSFRLEPAAELRPGLPRAPGGSSLLALVLRPFGVADGRVLTLLALALLAFAAARTVRAEDRPLAIAVATLVPATALGAVFGAGDVLGLTALVLAVPLSTSGCSLRLGLLLGTAVALDGRLWPAAAALGLAFALRAESSRVRARVATGLGLAALCFMLPAMLDPTAFLRALSSSDDLGPGAGLVGIFGYKALEAGPLLHAAIAAAAVLVIGLLFGARRAASSWPLGVAACGLLVGVALAARASPFVLGPVAALLGLGALPGFGQSGRTDAERLLK